MKQLLVLLILLHGSLTHAESDVDSGRKVIRTAGCSDCHTVSAPDFMAGGLRIDTEFGAFYTPNITPDDETGIGRWSEADLSRALRDGRGPDGRIYYPAFPYRSYTKITDEDIHKMYAYLRFIPPVKKRNRAHELRFPYSQRWLMWFWQNLFFRSRDNPELNIKIGYGPFRADPDKSPQWNRGAYLAEALLHCAECHSPRNAFGAPEPSKWYSGTDDSLTNVVIPNITPDLDSGLGHWSADDWMTFLTSGFTPEQTNPHNEMAEVIQNTSFLSKEDRMALVVYLRSQKPVYHPLP